MNYWGLPIADTAYLRENLKVLRWYVGNGGDREEGRKHFFSSVLLGYYDALWDGLDKTAGHLLYRLSDFLHEDERKRMMIYPSSDGSIIDAELGSWDSLEDWRAHWEKTHPVIPEFDFQKHLGIPELLHLPETQGKGADCVSFDGEL